MSFRLWAYRAKGFPSFPSVTAMTSNLNRNPSLHGISYPTCSYSSQTSDAATSPLRANAPSPGVPPAELIGGPAALYASLVLEGKLRNDPHQRKTVQVLQELYANLQTYTEPAILEELLELEQDKPVHAQKGKADMSSPDFAWQKEEDGILGMVGELVTGCPLYGEVLIFCCGQFTKLFKKKKTETNENSIVAPQSLYLYGDVGVYYDLMCKAPLTVILLSENRHWKNYDNG